MDTLYIDNSELGKPGTGGWNNGETQWASTAEKYIYLNLFVKCTRKRSVNGKIVFCFKSVQHKKHGFHCFVWLKKMSLDGKKTFLKQILAKKKILAKKHVFCHWHEMYPYVYRCKHIYIYVNVVWYRCLLTTRTPSKQVWGYWWHVAGKTAVSRCWTSFPPKKWIC